MPFRRPPADRVSPYRRLPLWLQWALPCTVGIVVVVLIIVFVQDHQGQDASEATVSKKNQLVEVQQADATIRDQQQPHAATAAAGLSAPDALARAITAWVDRQTRTGAMNGPVKGANCTTVSGAGSQRVALSCRVKAADVTYDFRGVVAPRTHHITFCQKIEYGSIYGMKIPALSGACT